MHMGGKQMKKITNKAILYCMDTSHDGIMISDADGNFLYMNEAYRQITKLGETAGPGTNIRDFYVDGVIEHEPACLESARTRKRVIRLHTQDRNHVFIVSISDPIFDERGKLINIFTGVRDVSDYYSISGDMERLSHAMKRAVSENKEQGQYGGGVIAVSSQMRHVLDTAGKVSVFDVAVMITGESGTGKEVIAKYIHECSSRAKKPFIAINCAAIPEQLLETELFGYERGTFTGQVKEGKPGLFAAAEGGTLFLDEVGDMPLQLQAKLLRVLETKTYTPVGAQKSVPTDVRIVSATNRKISEMIATNRFREDLYYRLNVVELVIPPLRERQDDIVPLSMYFLEIANRKYNLSKSFSAITLKDMHEYKWPGNVRQLRNTVEMMVVVSSTDTLDTPDFLYSAQKGGSVPASDTSGSIERESEPQELQPLDEFIADEEKRYLELAYHKCRTTRKMAETLGIDHSTVIRKMKKYGINATTKSKNDR